jgi:hypothetical protein
MLKVGGGTPELKRILSYRKDSISNWMMHFIIITN